MDHRGLAMLFSAAASWSAPSCWAGSCPKGFIPSEDTGQLNGTTETAEGTSYDAMVTAPARGRGDRAGGPQRRRLHVVGGRRRPEQLGQSGPALHPPQAARPARRSSADEVAQSLTRKLAAVPGHAGVHHQPAGDQHRRARSPRACTSSPCRARTSDALYDGAADARAAAARRARAHRRDERPPDQESRRCKVTIDRDRASALGIDVEPDRERALQRLRRAAGQHHLHAERSVLGGHGAAAAVPARPVGA